MKKVTVSPDLKVGEGVKRKEPSPEALREIQRIMMPKEGSHIELGEGTFKVRYSNKGKGLLRAILTDAPEDYQMPEVGQFHGINGLSFEVTLVRGGAVRLALLQKPKEPVEE